MLGSPTVIADLAVTGPHAAVVGRGCGTWRPKGGQTMVARGGLPSCGRSGRQVFQLHPNGWRVAPGHIPKLELLGAEVPTGRAPNGEYTVAVSNLELRLPTADRAGARAQAPQVRAARAVRAAPWRYPGGRHTDGSDRCEPPAPRTGAAWWVSALAGASAAAATGCWCAGAWHAVAARTRRRTDCRGRVGIGYQDTREACGAALGAGAPRLSLCPPSWLSACPPGALGAPRSPTAPRSGAFPRKRGAAAGPPFGACAAARAPLNTATVLPMRVSTHQDHPIRRNVT